MAIHSEEIAITAGAWSKDADSWLSSAIRFPFMDGLREQVEQGIATLFYMTVNNETCGAFVLRIDKCGQINEGVICAASASHNGIDMMASIVPAIEKMFIGCHAIRFHTNTPAVARKMARFGYAADEIISRKIING